MLPLPNSPGQAISQPERRKIRALLADPASRRRLMTGCIVATQARKGSDTTPEQAETANDAVRQELNRLPGPRRPRSRPPSA